MAGRTYDLKVDKTTIGRVEDNTFQIPEPDNAQSDFHYPDTKDALDFFLPSFLAFFYPATRLADIAADLTAETFAAALASARSFDPEQGNARGWLFGIARHQLADAWERG